MPTLPWTAAQSPETNAQALVFGSRLELRSYTHIPGFMRVALQLRRQVRDTRGAFGVSLIAQPSRKTFWTLSAWSGQDALDAFVRTPTHQGVMQQYHDRMKETAFASWTMDAVALPQPRDNAKALWAEARARLAAAREGEQ